MPIGNLDRHDRTRALAEAAGNSILLLDWIFGVAAQAPGAAPCPRMRTENLPPPWSGANGGRSSSWCTICSMYSTN
jgi:hypothetical protein